MAWTPVWTSEATVKEHFQQAGVSTKDAVTSGMIVEAIGLAESTMIKRGIEVTVSPTDPVENETLVSGATLLAVAYCERSEVRKILVAGTKDADAAATAKALLQLAKDDEDAAWLILEPFYVRVGGLRTPVIRRNKNWARGRGGALSGGTEAGRHARNRNP